MAASSTWKALTSPDGSEGPSPGSEPGLDPSKRQALPAGVKRHHIHVTGIVQGVGFRPFVYNLALQHTLAGWVCNTSDGVDIEVQGRPEQLTAFAAALERQAPPLARIERVEVIEVAPNGDRDFIIRPSVVRAGTSLVSPDVATCPACLSELFDPADRRFGYPFTNCTHCGPRYTIITAMPYDRPATTMRVFPMCPQCQAEYENPSDRRFHAQPNACPVCGPHVRFLPAMRGAGGEDPPDDHSAIAAAVQALWAGQIVAVKGLGGFHLACDATNVATVAALRWRKARPAKPFAVMMATLDEVRLHCEVSPEAEALLTSAARPIVLLPWKANSTIAPAVAPRSRTLGVMLPYTPLHHLLLRQVQRPLVMTSGNRADEPIAQTNDQAQATLSGLADAFLLHNRDIHARCDDSVWFLSAGGPQPIRRSRGYIPDPLRLPWPVEKPVLAVGAELKNTFCLLKGDPGSQGQSLAFLSPHVGDLENLETLAFFEEALTHYRDLFQFEPQVIAHDLHPDYMSTQYARKLRRGGGASPLPTSPPSPPLIGEGGKGEAGPGGRAIAVQHHHAHIASCLADNGVAGPVIGVALDGTGYGPDGHIWGGEFLVADLAGFRRAGHLEYLPLPGGEAAIHKTWRLALAYSQTLLGKVPDIPTLAAYSPTERRIVLQQTVRGLNTPLTSSCGRLFDAVSALTGVCSEATYEGQAAIELEAVSLDGYTEDVRPYPFTLDVAEGVHILRLRPLFEALVADVRQGTPVAVIGARFHTMLVAAVLEVCRRLREQTGLNEVALSGGCFQNRLLLDGASQALGEAGFIVYTHHRVPANDGGVSLGQAIVAAFNTNGTPMNAMTRVRRTGDVFGDTG